MTVIQHARAAKVSFFSPSKINSKAAAFAEMFEMYKFFPTPARQLNLPTFHFWDISKFSGRGFIRLNKLPHAHFG